MAVAHPPVATREALTRDSIVAATRALIMSESLDAVSLRRVAASLGVTAPALYAHVTDKRDLMRGVAELELLELVDRFSHIDDPDPVVRMRQSSRAYIDRALEQPDLFRTMFLFPPDLDVAAATGEELPAATRAFEVPLVAIEEAIATGVFRDIDPAMAGLTLWVATHGCADVLLLGFALDEAARTAIIDNVLDTVIAGLMARPD